MPKRYRNWTFWRRIPSTPDRFALAGLIEFQAGNLDAATLRFAELVKTEKYLDDAFFYLD